MYLHICMYVCLYTYESYTQGNNFYIFYRDLYCTILVPSTVYSSTNVLLHTTPTLKGTTNNNTPLPAQTDVIRRWARYFFAAVHFPIQITFRICLTYFGGPQDARQHLWVITAGSRHFYRPIDITFRVSGRKTSTSRFDVPSCWFGSIVPQCVSVVPGLFWN